MRPDLVLVFSPVIDDVFGVFGASEPAVIQAGRLEPAVTGSHERVRGGLPGPMRCCVTSVYGLKNRTALSGPASARSFFNPAFSHSRFRSCLGSVTTNPEN